MKPILFNTEMVRAILDDRKSVTRRMVKPQPVDKDSCKHKMQTYDQMLPQFYKGDYSCVCRKCGYGIMFNGESCFQPPYCPGDILYVRETWAIVDEDIDSIFFENPELIPRGQVIYRSEYPEGLPECKWRPSIHMPKKAARLFLRVTDVRVERLKSITGYGVLAEGVDNGCSNPTMGKRWENMQRMNFSDFWNNTIKKTDLPRYGWAANPWVWVIAFEKISRQEAFG